MPNGPARPQIIRMLTTDLPEDSMDARRAALVAVVRRSVGA
jgi:hypothetical protein